MHSSNLRPLPCESNPANLQHPSLAHSYSHQPTAVRDYRLGLILAGVGVNELERVGVEHKMITEGVFVLNETEITY